MDAFQIKQLFGCAILLCFLPVVSVYSSPPPQAERADQLVDDRFTGTVVFYRGSLNLSACDGTPPLRIAVGSDDYSELVKNVEPLRAQVKNGRRMTVQGKLERTGVEEVPVVLMVTRIVNVGDMVDCDVLFTDRPLTGTQWIRVDEETGKLMPYYVRFGNKDHYVVHHGCNTTSGTYKHTPDHISLLSGMHTRIWCRVPDMYGIFDNKNARTFHYQIRNRTLIVSIPTGKSQQFIANEDISFARLRGAR